MVIPEIERKDPETFFILKIIAFELQAENCHNSEKDTCHWQSMFHKTLLRFNIPLREIFFISGSLWVMKKYDESTLILILQKFETL